MFKQNIKKEYTDKEIEILAKQASRANDMRSHNKITEENINNNKQKQVYHSSEDDDSDETTEIVPLKKRNRSTKHFDVNQETVSEADNVQNIEQDRKNVNQSRRQTILLSATLTQAVEKLAGLTMQDPIFVDAAKENLQMSGGDISDINEDLIVPQGVIQNYIVTPPKLRMVTLGAYIAGRCQVRSTSIWKIT